MRFDNRRLLVTGGTSGIGRATAERLTTEGAEMLGTGSKCRVDGGISMA